MKRSNAITRLGQRIASAALALALLTALIPARSVFAAGAWQTVGSAGFSTGTAYYTNIVINNGTPYVAFADDANSYKATVMKFNGTSWETVGAAGFTADRADYINLVFDNDTPYISFQDWSIAKKATVMKFNGTNWESVGPAGFSAGGTADVTLAFYNNTPYVSFQDWANSNKATVMKFNGTSWETVGPAGFSAGATMYNSLAMDNDTPYVAFRDANNSNKATVMKFNGASWEIVGAAGFTAGVAEYNTIKIDSGTPYIAYRDVANSYKASVMKFNGTSWEYVGTAGFSSSVIYFVFLAFDGGAPYMAYTDAAYDSKAVVKKFNGTTWESVGTPGFSDGWAGTPSLAFDNGTPYVVYRDDVASGKATVKKFILNNAPTDIALDNDSVEENKTVGTLVGNLAATDADAGDSHTFSFACTTPGADDASFQISGAQLQTNAVFDYETKTTYAICIRANDGNGGTYDENFTINVTNAANQTPTALALDDLAVNEGVPLGTLVGNLSATDPDAGDSHTYSFACSTPGADDASFQISGSQLQTNVTLDFDVKTTYDICIRADDDEGGVFDQDFTIEITDVNFPPIAISLRDVAENQPVGTFVGFFQVLDPDAPDTHTFSFCGGEGDASFRFNDAQLLTNAVFDYETKNSYAICVRADDGNGGTYDQAFTILIADVNESVASTFQSQGANDGWILETDEESSRGGALNPSGTTFNIGDDAANRQYRAILSFDTESLPDNAVITRITLKLRLQGMVGTDPFTTHRNVQVDIRKGAFNNDARLQASDFQANAQMNGGAVIMNTPVNSWYSVKFPVSSFAYFLKTGVTQLRLRFGMGDNNNNAADYLRFFSGDHTVASVRPTLIIEYYVP